MVSAVAGGLVTLVAVSFVVFLAVEALPGDAATRLLGPNASPDRVASMRERLGLDRPVLARYGSWLAGVVRGDLGTTASGGASVAEVVWRPVRNSAVLATVAGVGAVCVATAVGVATGARAGRRSDGGLGTANLAAVATPDFVWAAAMVVVFALTLGWLPAVSIVPAGGTPFDRPSVLVVPAAAMAISAGAFGARLVRAVIADAARRPFVTAARTAGVPEFHVVLRHIMVPAAGPLMRVLALLAPYVVGGSAAVERVVGYPGVGSLLAASLTARDVRVVEAVVLVMAATIVTVFVVTDLIARRLDVRSGGDAR